MDTERFELNLTAGDVSFHATGEAAAVMKAFAEFKNFANAQPRSRTTASSAVANGPEAASDVISDVPLPIFVKRSWPSQAAKATAIVMWAKYREDRAGLKPGDIEAYWRRTPGKAPANPSQVCASAVAQGWLHSEGSAVYSVTGHGEAMVNATPQSS
jgi:hypothetical protein